MKPQFEPTFLYRNQHQMTNVETLTYPLMQGGDNRTVQFYEFQWQDTYSHQFPQQFKTIESEEKYHTVNEQLGKIRSFPPSLDNPDCYLHYKYLIQLKDTHKFSDTLPPPQYLINYLFQFLSLQSCPYALSVLSFIAVNIPYFHLHFSEQQLHYLLVLVNRKYPCNIDYSQQYKKLEIMDKTQSRKLLDLMQTLCLIVGRIEQQQFVGYEQKQDISIQDEKNQKIYNNKSYMEWVMNCLHVSVTHLNRIKLEHTEIQLQNEINQLNSTTQKTVIELVNLLKFYNFTLSPNQYAKIMDILFQLIPDQTIVELDKMQNVFSLIQISKIYTTQLRNNLCPNNRQFYELFDILLAKLLSELNRISIKVLKNESKLHQNLQIRTLYNQFCLKVTNILSLKQWTKEEDIELIRLIQSCNFICGMQLESNREEIVTDCKNIISFAISISKDESMKEQLKDINTKEGKRELNENNDDFW